MYLKNSIQDYLNQLSSEQPIPGGGGTSALVAALGISLILMVARISLKKADKRTQKRLSRSIEFLEKLRRDAEEAIDLDPKIYEEVMSAYKRAKQASDRTKAQNEIETSLANSFRLQADLSLLSVMAKDILTTVGAIAKGSIRNDLIVASGLLDGAFQGAVATARINVVYMKDGKQKKHFENALKKLDQKYKKIKFV
jgi:formiminotetrahydrofolate cyclodeaminase